MRIISLFHKQKLPIRVSNLHISFRGNDKKCEMVITATTKDGKREEDQSDGKSSNGNWAGELRSGYIIFWHILCGVCIQEVVLLFSIMIFAFCVFLPCAFCILLFYYSQTFKLFGSPIFRF